MASLNHPVDQSASAPSESETDRDWLHLSAAQVRVAALSPAIAVTLFTLLSPDRKSILHWGRILALLATIFCTYLFFGVFAFIGVLLVSPLLWAISRLPRAITGRLLAFAFGGASACAILAKDMPAFQMAASATAAFGSAAHEKSWRKAGVWQIQGFS